MEPDRYWFLYLGLLFIFLGSEMGQEICARVFSLVCAGFYMALALLFATASFVLRVIGTMLLWLVSRWAGGEEEDAKEPGGRNFDGDVE